MTADASVVDQIKLFIDEVLAWLETITSLFTGVENVLDSGLSIIESSEGIIEGIFNIGTFVVENIGVIIAGIAFIATSIVTILTAIVSIGGLIVTIAGGIAAFAVTVALYIFTSLPYYKLGKKAGVKCAWLAWMPIPGLDYYCRLYVLSMIPGEKPVSIFGDKFTIPNRFLMFWVCMGIRFLGVAAITTVVAVISPILIVIPVVGEIYLMLAPIVGPLIYMLPTLLVVFLEFAFLYDALCTFKENKKSNLAAAIIVTVIDNVFTLNLPTSGFATTIYLYTLLKRQPIAAAPQEEVAQEDSVPQEEAQPALPSEIAPQADAQPALPSEIAPQADAQPALQAENA